MRRIQDWARSSRMKHMRDEAARIKFVTSDEPSFRAFELNQAISPTREMICSPSDLIACTVPEVDYSGPAYLGFDVGEAGSGTAACCYWPRTGALRTWLAFGDVPKLKARGKRDGADYYKMQHRGELVTHPGRTVDLLSVRQDGPQGSAGCQCPAVRRRHIQGRVAT